MLEGMSGNLPLVRRRHVDHVRCAADLCRRPRA